MANSIALAQKYLPLLDEVYKVSSRTSVLDATNVEFLNANTIKYYKTSMNGLGTYDRNGGFVAGDVSGVWETQTLTQDRGRSFMVDAMDDEESMNMAFGTLASEFIRTQVAPEIDAYTFAKLAGTTGIRSATGDITVGTTDVPTLIDAAEMQLNEDEVPYEGRLLFISETAYAGLRNKITRQVMNAETGINHEVEIYDNMRVIRVPQTRFYTAITMYDGKTSGQTAGGFIPTVGGYKVNFMIVDPTAVAKCAKHVVPRIFTPAENQSADAYKFDYRIYHDTFVRDNKVHGIYLHRGTTAIA